MFLKRFQSMCPRPFFNEVNVGIKRKAARKTPASIKDAHFKPKKKPVFSFFREKSLSYFATLTPHSKTKKKAEKIQLIAPVYQLNIMEKATESESIRNFPSVINLWIPRSINGSITTPSSHMMQHAWAMLYWQKA